MNEPIISPWVFYGIYLANSLNNLPLLLIACFLCWILCKGAQFMIIEDVINEDEIKEITVSAYKMISKWIVAIVTSCCIAIFIPSESTMYKMLVASYITPHNISVTGEVIEKSFDKAVEKIMKVVDK